MPKKEVKTGKSHLGHAWKHPKNRLSGFRSCLKMAKNGQKPFWSLQFFLIILLIINILYRNYLKYSLRRLWNLEYSKAWIIDFLIPSHGEGWGWLWGGRDGFIRKISVQTPHLSPRPWAGIAHGQRFLICFEHSMFETHRYRKEYLLNIKNAFHSNGDSIFPEMAGNSAKQKALAKGKGSDNFDIYIPKSNFRPDSYRDPKSFLTAKHQDFGMIPQFCW